MSANLAVNQKAAYRDYYNASGYLRYRQDWYKMVNTYGQGENGLYGYYNAMVDTKKRTRTANPYMHLPIRKVIMTILQI